MRPKYQFGVVTMNLSFDEVEGRRVEGVVILPPLLAWVESLDNSPNSGYLVRFTNRVTDCVSFTSYSNPTLMYIRGPKGPSSTVPSHPLRPRLFLSSAHVTDPSRLPGSSVLYPTWDRDGPSAVGNLDVTRTTRSLARQRNLRFLEGMSDYS